MNDLWVNLRDAPLGARVAHGVLLSVLRAVSACYDRHDLEPLAENAEPRTFTWDADRGVITFHYGDAIFSCTVDLAVVVEQRGAWTTLYGPSGRAVSVSRLGADEKPLARVRRVRDESAAPPRAHLN